MVSLLHNKDISKKFNKFDISITQIFDSMTILISNNKNIYEESFKFADLNKKRLLKGNDSIEEISEFISDLIDNKNIKIEENESDLKLTLISNVNYPNVDLIVRKKEKDSTICDEKTINKKLENLIKQNEETKQYFNQKIDELNKKIEFIEKENSLSKKEIKGQKNIIEEQNIKIDNYENKINVLEEKLKQLEDFKNNINIKEVIKEIKTTKSINLHEDTINSISIFPSGNIVSVSRDKSIKIFDNKNNKILQNIKNAHNDSISYVNIKDENNFVTCSWDKNIKTWIKKDNEFILNKSIINAHNFSIYKVIYSSNGNLISCSNDKTIKIWEEKENEYKLKTSLNDISCVHSILLLENKNKLISSGLGGTKIWNFDIKEINNIKLIKSFENIKCNCWNAINKFNDDSIIIGGKTLNIISLSQEKIIKSINIPFCCYGTYIFEEKGIFLIGGESNDIIIYNYNTFEYIKTIKDAHYRNIVGFCKINNDLISTFSFDNTIKFWKI